MTQRTRTDGRPQENRPPAARCVSRRAGAYTLALASCATELSKIERYCDHSRGVGRSKSDRSRKVTPQDVSRSVKNPGDNLLSHQWHYHRPRMLNGRVRNGNGCGHPGLLTGKLLAGKARRWRF